MARRNRRRSALHGLIPDLGTVQPIDVAAGALVGLVVSAGLKAAIKKYAPTVATSVPAGVLPAGLGVSAGAVLYYVQKGMAPQRASGHAVGAAVAGLAVAALDYLKSNNPAPEFLDFSAPPVGLNLSDYSGLLVENQATQSMGGLLVDNASMGALGVASMGGDDEMGYSDIVALQS
jgi:hypothetical protein